MSMDKTGLSSGKPIKLKDISNGISQRMSQIIQEMMVLIRSKVSGEKSMRDNLFMERNGPKSSRRKMNIGRKNQSSIRFIQSKLSMMLKMLLIRSQMRLKLFAQELLTSKTIDPSFKLSNGKSITMAQLRKRLLRTMASATKNLQSTARS